MIRLRGSALKSTRATRAKADDERKRSLARLAESADERAQHATKLLKKKGVGLDDLLARGCPSARARRAGHPRSASP
ncbi:hypothetical protein [Mycolicibacterium pyrenivorans]|uniref:hypothetical protein n=1 Tax=Mycolicibacterium pyrenivorans TaxID=187102 RepID=UPI0021F38F13|nr:hypothetical protein [Mycolicibacterium pyrenivorans]MCV7155032.1 hypothetical protein [Mycolicibacterium pyrenivorans]